MFTERIDHLPRPERPEAVYKDIETRIGIVKDVWSIAQTLSTRPSQIDLEKSQRLRTVLAKAKTQFPQEATLLNRYHQIDDQLMEGANQHGGMTREGYPEAFVKTPEFAILTDEELRIETNPDFMFLRILEDGIEAAIAKRQDIRELQIRMGSRINQQGFADNPAAYNDENDIPTEVSGHINAVLFQPFSVCLLIDHEAFVEFVGSNDIAGTYQGGIFTYVDTQQADKQELEESYKHENFHSFMEGFKTQNRRLNNSKNPIPNSSQTMDTLDARVKSFISFKTMDAPLSIMDTARMMMKTAAEAVSRQVENSNEELLSELASNKNRKNVPSNSFSILNEEAKSALDLLKGKDHEVDAILNGVASTIDIDKLVGRIRDCYQKVLKTCPKKTLDLDCAFAIIPPNKISIVEKLVDRWIQTAQATSPSHSRKQFQAK